MATFVIDARSTFNQSDEIVALELEYDERSMNLTAERSWTLDRLANEIMAHASDFPPAPDRTFQRRLTIEAHQETVNDVAIWIVDDVSVETLPDEAAQDGFENLPGWATWTANEAAAWIDTNVTDLASAKTALAAMARAIVFLRDWRR